jgi:hypothetical protein
MNHVALRRLIVGSLLVWVVCTVMLMTHSVPQQQRVGAQEAPTMTPTASATAEAAPEQIERLVYLPLIRQGQETERQPPPVSRSYYVRTINPDDMCALGYSLRLQRVIGIVILNFGSPRNLGTNVVPDYGTRLLLPPRNTVGLDDIAAAVEAFANGYARGCEPQTPPQPEPPDIWIGVGTTNSKVFVNDNPDNPLVDNPALTRGHGIAWAEMVSRVNENVGRPGVRAVGAYDAEHEATQWSSPEPTLAWARGYSSVEVAAYYNFGSAEDVPRDDPKPWSQRQLAALERNYELSWGLIGATPLPQIYLRPYEQEWYNVKRYANETYGRNMTIRGVVSTCGRVPSCDPNTNVDWRDVPIDGRTFLSQTQAWKAMYETLTASTAPDGTPNTLPPVQAGEMIWLTDFLDQP